MTITENAEAMTLVTQLMAQNAKDLAFTTNALLEGYRRDYAENRARLEIAEDRLARLLEYGFMPTPERLWSIFRPSEAEVSDRVASILREGKYES